MTTAIGAATVGTAIVVVAVYEPRASHATTAWNNHQRPHSVIACQHPETAPSRRLGCDVIEQKPVIAVIPTSPLAVGRRRRVGAVALSSCATDALRH